MPTTNAVPDIPIYLIFLSHAIYKIIRGKQNGLTKQNKNLKMKKMLGFLFREEKKQKFKNVHIHKYTKYY